MIIALVVYLSWNYIRKKDLEEQIGKRLFYFFLFLQLCLLIINLLNLPKFLATSQNYLPFHTFVLSVLNWLSNITLTTPLNVNANLLVSVFWSLAPEVCFYLLYPFLVLPLILTARKNRWWIGLIIILVATKILLDLDLVLDPIRSFHTINLARMNGFIAGVTIGSLYFSQSKSWNFLKKILSNPLVSFVILVGFIALHLANSKIIEEGILWQTNLYYLLSSWVIALVILVGLIPQTIINKIFSQKFLVNLGAVSYSLYLIHQIVIPWGNNIALIFVPFLPAQLAEIARVLLDIFLSIGISFILYRLIEGFYFSSKKNNHSVVVVENNQSNFAWNPLIIAGVLSLTIFISYSGLSYAPTLFLAHHDVAGFSFIGSQKSLLDQKLQIPITAADSNLSVIVVNMRYLKDADYTSKNIKNPAILDFRLYEQGNPQPIFQSQRHAYEVGGLSHFPFGFPTIKNSAQKKYVIELELENGNVNDQVLVDTSSDSVVSLYTNSKQDILYHPYKMLFNRWQFAFSNPSAIFALLAILVLAMLYNSSLIES